MQVLLLKLTLRRYVGLSWRCSRENENAYIRTVNHFDVGFSRFKWHERVRPKRELRRDQGSGYRHNRGGDQWRERDSSEYSNWCLEQNRDERRWHIRCAVAADGPVHHHI